VQPWPKKIIQSVRYINWINKITIEIVDTIENETIPTDYYKNYKKKKTNAEEEEKKRQTLPADRNAPCLLEDLERHRKVWEK
jgi:hypothetical protein